MKINPSCLHTLRLFAAASITMLAVSCEKTKTTAARTPEKSALADRTARDKEPRDMQSRTSGFQWKTGASNSYSIELSYSFGKPGAAADAESKGLIVRGDYHLAVLAAENNTVTLAATLSDTRVLRAGENCPILGDLVNSSPAIITLSGDGSIKEIGFAANIPDRDRTFLRAIYGFEFQMRNGVKTWTTKESEAYSNSEFIATYSYGNEGSVMKTRKISAKKEGPEQEILTSKFIGKVGKCWLDSLKGSETTAISNEGTVMGETHMSLTLEHKENTELPEIAKRLIATMPKSGEFTPVATEAAAGCVSAFETLRMGEIHRKFENVPFEVPFDALAKVSDTGNHADALPALNEFSDMLKARPELAARVVESLKTNVTPRMSALLAHSLELANTESSQKALATILKNPRDYSSTVLAQSIVAAGGLGAIKDPAIIEGLDEIQSNFGDNQDEYPLSDAALFSMSRLAQSNPELQGPLAATLKNGLASTSDETRRTAVLALTNAKIYDAELMTLAQDLFTSSEPETRSSALAYFEAAPALGTKHIESVSDLLKDSNVSVQVQAVSTLMASYEKNEEPSSLAALKAIIGDNSASKEVRENAMLAVKKLNDLADS
jgi:hypothetical protein